MSDKGNAQEYMYRNIGGFFSTLNNLVLELTKLLKAEADRRQKGSVQ